MPSVTTVADLVGYTLVMSFKVNNGDVTYGIFFSEDNYPATYGLNISYQPGSTSIVFRVTEGGSDNNQSISLGGAIQNGVRYVVTVKINSGSIGDKKLYTLTAGTLSQVGSTNTNAQSLTLANAAQLNFCMADDGVGVPNFAGTWQKVALFSGDPSDINIQTMLNTANPNTGTYTFVSFFGWYDATVTLFNSPSYNSTEVTFIDGYGEFMTFSSFSPFTGGGGGGGDPYITTLEGIRYKLPIMDGAIRFYQGEVDGKTLTINAQLKTMENSDMIAENIRSYNDLKSKMPAYKLKEIQKSLFATETLAFFEKFYIHYGDTELTLDVWDHKFKVESYKGTKIPSALAEGNTLTQKYTGVYKDYKSQTLKLSIGSSMNLYFSVYPAKLLKNGIYMEGVPTVGGNGVLTHTLSQKDMTLESLTDLKAVPARNTRTKEKMEWFLDKDGYRTKKIHLAA